MHTKKVPNDNIQSYFTMCHTVCETQFFYGCSMQFCAFSTWNATRSSTTSHVFVKNCAEFSRHFPQQGILRIYHTKYAQRLETSHMDKRNLHWTERNANENNVLNITKILFSELIPNEKVLFRLTRYCYNTPFKTRSAPKRIWNLKNTTSMFTTNTNFSVDAAHTSMNRNVTVPTGQSRILEEITFPIRFVLVQFGMC